MAPLKVHSHYCQRLRMRLRQIAPLCLWDVASNAKNEYRTHSLRLTQIMQKNTECELTFRVGIAI